MARKRRWIRTLWRRWRKRQARLARERQRAEKAATRRASVRSTKAQPVIAAPEPSNARVRLHRAAAATRSRVLRTTAGYGRPQGKALRAQQWSWANADVAELNEQAHAGKLRRIERRNVYLCGGHNPPQRFATVDELNQHFASDHDEPVRHPRGQEAKPKPRPRQLPQPSRRSPARQPQPTRRPADRPAGWPDDADTRRRTREHTRPVGASTLPPPRRRTVTDSMPRQWPPPVDIPPGTNSSSGVAARRANPTSERDLRLRVIKHHMDKIRKDAVSNVGAGNAQAALGDIGSTPVQSVSQIREIATAIEALGLQFEEAIEGFQQNARTSERAPIKEEVLRTLDPAKEGGQMVARAAVTFVSAFDAEYGDDIREAQAGERMDNNALTS